MPRSLPPGPKDSFFGIGLVGQFTRDPLGFLTQLQQKYGDLAYMRLGPYKTYWVFHPELMREVLVTKAKHFRRQGRAVDVLRQWNGNSLVTSDGEFWLRERRLVQPAFHPRRFGAYAASMVSITQRQAERWLQERPRQVEINQAMTGLTQEIIAKTLFDVEVADETQRLGEAVAILSETAMREASKVFPLPDWLPFPAIRRKLRAMRYLDQVIRRIIRQRRATGEDHGDLLSMLLHAVDEEGDGGGLSDEQVRNELMTFFLAGHDTTAGSLAWVWYHLARDPQIQARVYEEVSRVLGDRTPAAEDAPRLGYTEMVIKETLRLYPQAYVLFVRVAAEDVPLGDYVIPKGGQVNPVPYVMHHDERWFPNPEQFDPERFSPERQDLLPPYAYVPFGAGPRVCIGAAFAMMEMTLIVATLVREFQFALAAEQGEAVPAPLFSLRPRGGVQLTLRPRTAH